MNAVVIKPTSSEIFAITSRWPPQLFARESPLFYSGQVPNLVFLLTAGQIIVKDEKQKREQLLHPLALVGFDQVLKSIPTKSTAIIRPNSKACLIDKLTLLEFIQSGDLSMTVFQNILKGVSRLSAELNLC